MLEAPLHMEVALGASLLHERAAADHELVLLNDSMIKLPSIDADVDILGGETTEVTRDNNSLGSRSSSGYSLLQQIGLAHSADENLTENAAVDEPNLRKIICRYGRGCTHMYDVIHRERFWHPENPSVTHQELENCYICNECGYSTSSIQNLTSHIKNKTAWTNLSLIGCRVSCLVDYKEWHEGFVINYHKSGKHQFEFPQLSERRWLSAKKTAFYIIERPILVKNDDIDYGLSEVKESEVGELDENWDYCEEISAEFAFSQSVLFKIYGAVIQETGHKTRGHICLTEDDKAVILAQKGSLLYGELLPRGLNKALSRTRLNAGCATTLFDLGMGTGKVCIQSFLQYKNLEYVYGVELSLGRYNLAEQAVLNMAKLLGKDKYDIEVDPGKGIIVRELYLNESGETIERILHFQCCSLFEINNIAVADIIMLETDIPIALLPDLYNLLCKMHVGARVLSYLDFKKVWSKNILSFKQLDINRYVSDRYPTSWSVQRGHHLYIWTKEDAQALAYNDKEYAAGGKSRKSIASYRHNSHNTVKDSERDGCEPVGGCFSLLRLLQTFGFLRKRLFNGEKGKGEQRNEDFSITNEDDDCCEEYEVHSHRNAVNMPNNVIKESNDGASFTGERSNIFVQQGDDTHPMTPKIVLVEDSALRTNTLPALLTPISSPDREVETDSMNTPLDIKGSVSPFRDHGNSTPPRAFIKPLKLPSFTESNHTLMIDNTVDNTRAVHGRSNKYCVIS